MHEFVETLTLPFRLGPMCAKVTNFDGNTTWIDGDPEVDKVLEAGKRMSSALPERVQKRTDLNKLLTTLEMRPAEPEAKCRRDREQYTFGLKKYNAKLSAEIRTLEHGIETVAHVIKCKRYKDLYDTAHRNMCAHKQLKDDHEGRHAEGICNSTGRVLKAKQVANYNRSKPHGVDGGEYNVKFTSRIEVHEHGPEDSVHQFCTWECIDADAANRGMDAELKKALDDAYNALDSNMGEALTE